MLRAVHAVFGGLVARLILVISIYVWRIRAIPEVSNDLCPAGFANFGDSLTDTGNTVNNFPFTWDQESPPYGETFFGRPAKRFCNGRVVPDFFSLAFHKPLLEPYNAVTAFQYKYGINFAASGATAAPTSSAANPASFFPYQVAQFERFAKSVAAVRSQPACGMFVSLLPQTTHSCELVLASLPEGPGDSYIGRWLFTIETGGNDLMIAMGSITAAHLKSNPSTSENVYTSVVAKVTQAITSGIQRLYKAGGRNFLVFGLPAQGCAPCVLTQFDSLPKDRLGCVTLVNEVVQALNTELLRSIKDLRVRLQGSSIAFFDYYKANVDILAQPTTYGFGPELTKTACCGAPGPYNYKANVMCGHSGSNKCADPEQYIIWDGIHFTDAFYRLIARFALAGLYTDGGIPYQAFCNLDFSLFGPSSTYKQAYPFACDTGFV